jgi:hypothetical protein
MQSRYTRSGERAQDFKLDPRDHDTIGFVASESDRPKDRTIVRARQIAHLRNVFAGRITDHLYDAEPKREHILALLRVMAAIPRIRTEKLVQEVQRWAPSMSKGARSELIDEARRKPCVFRKETIGKIIELVDAERTKYKAWALWPVDLSLSESKLRKKPGKRKRDTERRRAAGVIPRSEYLAKVASKEPWVPLNISRAKYFRLKAKGMLPVSGETGSAPSTTVVEIDKGIRDSEGCRGHAPSLTVEPAPVPRPTRERAAADDELSIDGILSAMDDEEREAFLEDPPSWFIAALVRNNPFLAQPQHPRTG